MKIPLTKALIVILFIWVAPFVKKGECKIESFEIVESKSTNKYSKIIAQIKKFHKNKNFVFILADPEIVSGVFLFFCYW